MTKVRKKVYSTEVKELPENIGLLEKQGLPEEALAANDGK